MSKDTPKSGYHNTVEDYNRHFIEGQSDSEYMEQHDNDVYNQQRSTLTGTGTTNIGMRKFQTGERDLDFGHHGVGDYNKILGEGQDDYTEEEYMKVFHRQQDLKNLQGQQKQQYPPTHLYGKNDADNYLPMNSEQYQRETYEEERGNIESNIQIPGCGQAKVTGEQHRYVSNQFQPTVMLQARKMDDSHIPIGSVDTSCPGFQGEGHHTPVPGAGKVSSQPGYHHINPFHLVESATNDNVSSKDNTNMGMGTSYTGVTSGEEAIPRTMKPQEQQDTSTTTSNTTTPIHTETKHHYNIFSRLKKTISR